MRSSMQRTIHFEANYWSSKDCDLLTLKKLRFEYFYIENEENFKIIYFVLYLSIHYVGLFITPWLVNFWRQLFQRGHVLKSACTSRKKPVYKLCCTTFIIMLSIQYQHFCKSGPFYFCVFFQPNWRFLGLTNSSRIPDKIMDKENCLLLDVFAI